MAAAALPAQTTPAPAQGPPRPQIGAGTAPPGDALDEPLLQDADEDQVPSDLFSRLTLKYDHLAYAAGYESDRFRLSGQQALDRNRFSLGYELPFLDLRGGAAPSSGPSLGDIKLSLNAGLGRWDRFTNAATIEATLPSASEPGLGLGQNLLRMAWGFSIPLARETVLSGTLAYNKGVSAPAGQQGANSFEPEWVLAQGIGRHLAGFLDWDTYRDFNAGQFGQTLKAGLVIQLEKTKRWSASPYGQFPLNHFTSAGNIRSDAGVDVSFRY